MITFTGDTISRTDWMSLIIREVAYPRSSRRGLARIGSEGLIRGLRTAYRMTSYEKLHRVLTFRKV